uniref:MARVEL domain-containing protein n=1 Tax=Megaselia scalaris TaxID=36166 RepID=T1GZK5_MEGSC
SFLLLIYNVLTHNAIPLYEILYQSFGGVFVLTSSLVLVFNLTYISNAIGVWAVAIMAIIDSVLYFVDLFLAVKLYRSSSH